MPYLETAYFTMNKEQGENKVYISILNAAGKPFTEIKSIKIDDKVHTATTGIVPYEPKGLKIGVNHRTINIVNKKG